MLIRLTDKLERGHQIDLCQIFKDGYRINPLFQRVCKGQAVAIEPNYDRKTCHSKRLKFAG